MLRFAVTPFIALAIIATERPAYAQATQNTRSKQPEARSYEVEAPHAVPRGCYEVSPGLYVYPPPDTPVTGDRVRPQPYYVYRAPEYHERSAHFVDRRHGSTRRSFSNRYRYDYRRRATPRRGRYYSNRYYDDRPYYYSDYDYGQPYPSSTYGYRAYDHDLSNAYEQGRYDADNDYVSSIASLRAGMLINQSRAKFKEAIIYFRDGKYDRAVINMLGAAEKNQADPASRLHAGHALFALGQYEEAVRLLARAFELSPSLAYKNYDIRDEYGNKEDFDRHLLALRTYLDAHPNSAAALTLMGYVTFYTEGPGAAYSYLAKAAKLNPLSYFIPKLEKLARYASKGEAGLDLMPKSEESKTPQLQPQESLPAVSPTSPNTAPRRSNQTPDDQQSQGLKTQYERRAV